MVEEGGADGAHLRDDVVLAFMIGISYDLANQGRGGSGADGISGADGNSTDEVSVEAGHPPRSRGTWHHSRRGGVRGDGRLCALRGGFSGRSRLRSPTSAVDVPREAGGRADAQGEADGVASRRRNCHSRTQPQPPGSSKEQQSSHACRDHTFPHAVPLSVACPPPHPRSPRRPPRHVRRENHRRRSGGRHGWP